MKTISKILDKIHNISRNRHRYNPIILLAVGLLPCLAGSGLKADARPLVGAYYYPWYGPGAHTIADSARMQLKPAQKPLLGDYDSRGQNVILQHINQSVRGNIAFWACSWWGPGSYEDVTIKNHLRKYLSGGRLKYAILYESTGRLRAASNPSYNTFLTDVDYLARTFFPDDSYLRIDGRPVLFIYLTRVYFRDKGDEVLARLRAAHPDLYIVADDVFGPDYRAAWAARWDAVTAYDAYGQSLGIHGSTAKAIATLAANYAEAKAAADVAGTAFVPAVTPGFNDKAVRGGHRVAPRYLEDEQAVSYGAVFTRMLKEAALPFLDVRAERMLMVTSFNEWHEDTQIEPTAGRKSEATGLPAGITENKLHEDYGFGYLDILREVTCEEVD
ncbi:MAG: glycoside hydrolase family 99-like domain-containing protein [Bacteroidota bacterium]